ncbi:MAG: uroporphyrinogen-III synthase [Stellaceae bacterium]
MLLALVTRPHSEAKALAARLAERGIASVIEPMIEIVTRGGVVPDMTEVQAALLTSANGARALARASDARDVPILAVGDATARAARDAGFGAVESAGGDVEDLARLVARRLRPADGKLLHVAGSEVAGDLAGTLGAAGFTVERAVLYEARAATALTLGTARLIADAKIDLALFFSPRSATIFARLAEAAGASDGLVATTAVSISATTDAALRDLRFHDHLIAAAPTQAALLACIHGLVGPLAKVCP